MKNLFLIANWKSHKSVTEAISWHHEFVTAFPASLPQKTVVVGAPFTVLQPLQEKLHGSPAVFRLAAQNLSPFESGAYTGEISAEMLKGVCSYVIVGHSERRNYFKESDALIAQKVAQALRVGISPILCVQDATTPVPEGVTLVAYEPFQAIGSGHPDTPDDAAEVASQLKALHPTLEAVLYGGSVTPDNVAQFTQQEAIDGVLVGGASLHATTFAQLIRQA